MLVVVCVPADLRSLGSKTGLGDFGELGFRCLVAFSLGFRNGGVEELKTDGFT